MFRLRPAVVVVAPDSGAQEDRRIRVAIVLVAVAVVSEVREVRVELSNANERLCLLSTALLSLARDRDSDSPRNDR